MKGQILSLLFAAISFVSPASGIDSTFKTASNTASYLTGSYGFRKTKTYDVAINITVPAVIGTKVTGLSVYLPVTANAATDLPGCPASVLKLVDKRTAQ